MPNRMLRDWTDSEKVDTLSVHAERFFTRLIMKVDDYGRYPASPKYLRAMLFPLKEDMRETDISRCLNECQVAGLIALYEVEKKEYVQINDFRQRLRQKTEKYPCPTIDGQMTVTRQTDDSLKRREEEVEEKGREYVPPDEKIVFTIEHCLVVAMNDSRWVKANKTNEAELQVFNSTLEKQGRFKENPAEYKRYFANWKNKQGKIVSDESSPTTNNIREAEARRILGI